MAQWQASGNVVITAKKAIDTALMPSRENDFSAEPEAKAKDRKASTVVIDVKAEAGPTRRIESFRFAARLSESALDVCQR